MACSREKFTLLLPIVQEAGWTPGPVWTGAENLVLTGIRSPDRPARSVSLYRLSYTGPHGGNTFLRKLGSNTLRYAV